MVFNAYKITLNMAIYNFFSMIKNLRTYLIAKFMLGFSIIVWKLKFVVLIFLNVWMAFNLNFIFTLYNKNITRFSI